MKEITLVTLVLCVFLTGGCGANWDFKQGKFATAIGIGQVGTNCDTLEDGSYSCEQEVNASGFSNPIGIAIGAVLRGVVGFFVPSVNQPEPQPIVINVPAQDVPTDETPAAP